MAGKKIGSMYSTGASAVASRKSYNKKREAEATKQRQEAKRRKSQQRKREQEQQNLAALLEGQKDRGEALKNDTATQFLLAQKVVAGTAAGATVPNTIAAAAPEPELSEGEVEEDESVSLVVPAASNVPIGKSDRYAKSFTKPAPSVCTDPFPLAHTDPLAFTVPRKTESVPTSTPTERSLVGVLKANISTPDKLVGVALLCYSEDDIAACVQLDQFDSRRYQHAVDRLTKRSGMSFPGAVADLLRKGKIQQNPNAANYNSTLAVAYVDELDVYHWFPFDIVDGRMSIRTYFAHSPFRGERYKDRRRFLLKGLRWLAEALGVRFDEVVSRIVAALSTTESHKLSCGASSPSIEDIVIFDVIAKIQPTGHELAVLSNIPYASSMGDFEEWIVRFNDIPRVEEKLPFMRSTAKKRYELSLEFDPNRHPIWIEEDVSLEFWQGFLRL